MKLLNDEARYIHKNIENRGLFVRIDEDSDESEDDSQQFDNQDDSSVEEVFSEKVQRSMQLRKRVYEISSSNEEDNN